jgi:hypothetical protein
MHFYRIDGFVVLTLTQPQHEKGFLLVNADLSGQNFSLLFHRRLDAITWEGCPPCLHPVSSPATSPGWHRLLFYQ